MHESPVFPCIIEKLKANYKRFKSKMRKLDLIFKFVLLTVQV